MSSTRKSRNSKPYSRPGDGQWLHDKAPGVVKAATTTNANTTQSTQLMVANLHYEVTPADLTSIFGQIGTLVREPNLRYDRSGRSTGTAVVSFEVASDATKAKKQFDGLTAKGQPMSITYHILPTRGRHAPTTSALLSRIEKQPLLDRLGGDEPKSGGPGPVRTKAGRGGKAPAKARPAKVAKKPKTAEDLDKELEAYGAEGDTPVAPVADVDMA